MVERGNPISRLCVVGVGLIGGSLARSLKTRGSVLEVVGFGRTEATLVRALELGVVDRYETDFDAAVDNAEIVVLAPPVRTLVEFFPKLRALSEQTIITDVGSVKGGVIESAKQSLGAGFKRFVPGHPIAGSEQVGVASSRADLFADHKVILTPLEETDRSAVARVRWMWEQTGARVLEMGVEEHDRALALTSHLPHILAYALVGHLASQPDPERIFGLAAGGFYDFTRIASSDPVMWRDICVMNRIALDDRLQEFKGELDALIAAVQAGDDEALERSFLRAKNARSQVADHRKRQGGAQ